MGLDDFISGDGDSNNEESGNNQKASKLSNKIQSTTTNQETDVGRCPSCGEKGEKTEYWYYRCPQDSDECSIITFIMPKDHRKSNPSDE